MPEIKLPDFLNNDVAALGAGYTILSYMLHPAIKDVEARDMFVKASHIKFIEKIESRILSNDSEITGDELVKMKRWAVQEFVEPFLDLPANKISFLLNINAQLVTNVFADKKNQIRWRTIGLIAHVLFRMEQHQPDLKAGTSIKKAIDFIVKSKKKGLFCSGMDVATNETDLWKIWREYKSVAHFMLPFWKMCSEPNESLSIFTSKGLEAFLVLADNAQRKMLSIVSKHGNKASIVSADDLWVLPAKYITMDANISFDPFNDDEIKILKKYQG